MLFLNFEFTVRVSNFLLVLLDLVVVNILLLVLLLLLHWLVVFTLELALLFSRAEYNSNDEIVKLQTDHTYTVYVAAIRAAMAITSITSSESTIALQQKLEKYTQTALNRNVKSPQQLTFSRSQCLLFQCSERPSSRLQSPEFCTDLDPRF